MKPFDKESLISKPGNGLPVSDGFCSHTGELTWDRTANQSGSKRAAIAVHSREAAQTDARIRKIDAGDEPAAAPQPIARRIELRRSEATGGMGEAGR